jgi:hypothetical protein
LVLHMGGVCPAIFLMLLESLMEYDYLLQDRIHLSRFN